MTGLSYKMVHIIDNSNDTERSAELSLKAIKNVLIEKPEFLNVEQAISLKKIAEESGVILQLGTGYKFCPVYCNLLKELPKNVKIINVRQLLTEKSSLKMELFYVIDFVTSILNVNTGKFEVKSWKNEENISDLLHCSLDCDNSSIINITTCRTVKSEPKFEIDFVSPQMHITADIFKSTIKKHYHPLNVDINIILESYCEKTVSDCYLQIFNRAVDNDLEAVRIIEKQFQNMITGFKI